MNNKLKDFQSHGSLLRGNRATGRTFRMILRAVLNASECKSTVLVFHSDNLCHDAYDKIRRIVAGGVGTTFFKSFDNFTIEFQNGACIGITTKHNLTYVSRKIHKINGDVATVYHDHFQGQV